MWNENSTACKSLFRIHIRIWCLLRDDYVMHLWKWHGNKTQQASAWLSGCCSVIIIIYIQAYAHKTHTHSEMAKWGGIVQVGLSYILHIYRHIQLREIHLLSIYILYINTFSFISIYKYYVHVYGYICQIVIFSTYLSISPLQRARVVVVTHATRLGRQYSCSKQRCFEWK